MEENDDQKLIGGVARRDSSGRLVNLQDLRFRTFVSPTPEIGTDEQDQVFYSIEARTTDQRRPAGPRDSVEPRYATYDRMTDEVRYIRAGFSDEPIESGRGTKQTQQSSYSSKLQNRDALPRTSLDAETPVSPTESVIFLDEYPSADREEASDSPKASPGTEAVGGDDRRPVSLCKYRCGAWFIDSRYASLHEQDFCPNKPP